MSNSITCENQTNKTLWISLSRFIHSFNLNFWFLFSDYQTNFGILTFRRYFSFQTSVFFKNHDFYDTNSGCSELEKYGYSERSSKNKRMCVKIFNRCSERQRNTHFRWRNWIILTGVRNENIGMFGTTINGCS